MGEGIVERTGGRNLYKWDRKDGRGGIRGDPRIMESESGGGDNQQEGYICAVEMSYESF